MESDRKAGKMGRPQRVEGQKLTRERILDAAIELFSDRGFDRTSVRDLAAAVDLTESAIYRHFEGKEAILKAIFALAEASIYDPLPIEANQGEYAGSSIFRGLLLPLPRIILSNPRIVQVMRILYAEMLHDAGIRRYYREAYIERADRYMESLFRSQIDKGAIRPCDSRALARVFNAFRSDWAIANFVLGPDRELGIEELERDLEGPIHFFEQFLVPVGN